MMHRMFVVWVLFVAVSCSSSRQSSHESKLNTLTSKERAEGWKLLFDGKTKGGWHVFNNKSDGAAWKVADGILYLDPKAKGPKGEGGGDIITDESFENFHLKLDWKIDTAGNSGVVIQAQEASNYGWAWTTGPEIQIVDNAAHPDAKIDKHRAGDLYDLISATPVTVKPAGEWNQLEIIQNNGRLDLFLNGTKGVSTAQWDDNWSKLVGGSKFKSMADFGKFQKGKIALQDHGDRVWFRNIMIKTL